MNFYFNHNINFDLDDSIYEEFSDQFYALITYCKLTEIPYTTRRSFGYQILCIIYNINKALHLKFEVELAGNCSLKNLHLSTPHAKKKYEIQHFSNFFNDANKKIIAN